MRRLVGLVLCLALLGLGTPRCEAGMGDALKNSGRYVGDLLHCLVIEAGQKVIGLVVDVSTCAIARANRNPMTLERGFTLPSSTP